MSFREQRRSYRRGALDGADLAPNPLRTLADWIEEARGDGDPEPTAMALATVDPDGQPTVRHVLTKGVTDRGIEFFTNLRSRKARGLDAEPRCAASFWWAGLERAARVVGRAELLPRDAVDAYFASRPRESRLGAFASEQSRPIESREALEQRLISADLAHPEPGPNHAPDAWGGYLIAATEVELWQGREGRLHDRITSILGEDGTWTRQRLQP